MNRRDFVGVLGFGLCSRWIGSRGVGLEGIRRDVRTGPRGAEVETVAELPVDGTAGDEPFTIRRS